MYTGPIFSYSQSAYTNNSSPDRRGAYPTILLSNLPRAGIDSPLSLRPCSTFVFHLNWCSKKLIGSIVIYVLDPWVGDLMTDKERQNEYMHTYIREMMYTLQHLIKSIGLHFLGGHFSRPSNYPDQLENVPHNSHCCIHADFPTLNLAPLL